MEDYEIKYNENWKDIVENKDGTLNKDQVMRELFDYSMVMKNCERAYSEMTRGRISKANTQFWQVAEIHNELFLHKGITQDDMKEMLKIKDIQELKKELKDYFEIEESE